MARKRVLFIDRDGTLIIEPPVDFQVDSLEKLDYYPGVFGGMSRIKDLDYELVSSPLRVVAPIRVNGISSICIERALGPLSSRISIL